MWVARDRNGDLRLFSLHNYKKEYQKPPIRDNRYGLWCVPCQTLNSMIDVMSIDPSLFPNLKWVDEPIEVSLVPNKIDKGDKERKESVKKCIKEYTAEEIYYFENGANPDYDEWVKAGIELEYGETEDDFEYYDYCWHRGDFDYTRN